MTCTCIEEPRGRNGLEGFTRGLKYRAVFREKDKLGRPYFRVYLSETYYETCSVRTFRIFFEQEDEVKKITFKPAVTLKASDGKERITIQFRCYDEDGNYKKDVSEKSNETLHLKNCDLAQAFEIVKAALMNSNLISNHFEVEQ